MPDWSCVGKIQFFPNFVNCCKFIAIVSWTMILKNRGNMFIIMFSVCHMHSARVKRHDLKYFINTARILSHMIIYLRSPKIFVWLSHEMEEDVLMVHTSGKENDYGGIIRLKNRAYDWLCTKKHDCYNFFLIQLMKIMLLYMKCIKRTTLWAWTLHL